MLLFPNYLKTNKEVLEDRDGEPENGEHYHVFTLKRKKTQTTSTCLGLCFVNAIIVSLN